MRRMFPSRAQVSIQYVEGWVISILVHALAVGTSVLAFSDLTLIQGNEPFRWEVSIVERAPDSVASPAPPVPAEQPELRATPPAQPNPIVETVRPTVQPVDVAMPAVIPPVPVEPEPVVKESSRELAIHEPVSEPEPVPVAQPTEPQPAIVEPDPIPAEKPVEATTVAKTEPTAEDRAAPAPPVSARLDTRTPDPPSMDTRPAPALQGPKTDYGWLARTMWERVASLKRYPHRARLNHWEGKVVLMAVIREDGHLAGVTVKESSGYDVLDDDAMELIRKACPLALTQPLGRPEIAVQVPVSYTLTQRR
jgi:protein TonB